VMFFTGTMIHEVCYQALYALVESKVFRIPWSATILQAAINALIGVLAFAIIDSAPGVMQRRRSRGATLSRRHF
jgi:hypothetical protein